MRFFSHSKYDTVTPPAFANMSYIKRARETDLHEERERQRPCVRREREAETMYEERERRRPCMRREREAVTMYEERERGRDHV